MFQPLFRFPTMRSSAANQAGALAQVIPNVLLNSAARHESAVVRVPSLPHRQHGLMLLVLPFRLSKSSSDFCSQNKGDMVLRTVHNVLILWTVSSASR